MNGRYAQRMQELLGEEYAAYAACLREAPVRGIRVNTNKIAIEEFRAIAPFPLEPVPWEASGFYIAEEKPGRCPYHDAGLFYVQEPSAMCAAPLLRVRPGERVLDLCSAPGGKGTQLAQAMGGQGILVLNEKMPDRARILLQNVERMGVTNAVVTCADPAALASRFAGYFDKILVDAPCSGEGMLRKEEAAAAEWSEEKVRMCADRQAKILDSAARMLAPGGTLVYSTCTFSREEDEDNAARFCAEHPAFSQEEQVKLYPHRVRGEGHFAARFVREDGEPARVRPAKPTADRRAVAAWKDFAADFLLSCPEGEYLSFGDALCLVPAGLFALDGLKVLRPGLCLGTYRNGRFEPAHALALGIARTNFARVVDCSEEEIARYLRGEELSADGKGWCAVAYRGWPVGLGKLSAGRLKNHYPKGLRH